MDTAFQSGRELGVQKTTSQVRLVDVVLKVTVANYGLLRRTTPSLASGLGERRSSMEQSQNQNYITLEIVMRFSMKDYRIILGLKRTWILAIVVGLTQLAVWLLKGRS